MSAGTVAVTRSEKAKKKGLVIKHKSDGPESSGDTLVQLAMHQ